MKTHLQLASVLAAVLLAANVAKASAPSLVPVDYNLAYTPLGFDTNDQVQFAAEGVFPDTCYKAAPPEVEVDPGRQAIYVRPRAFRYVGPCADVLVPFHQVIEVGLVPTGTYSIYSGTSRRLIGRLPVKLSTSASPDDHLYAPVSQVYYRKNTAYHVAILSGEFSNSCMSLKDTIVKVQRNVIVVQPISEFTQGSQCRNGRFPFEKAVKLPPMKSGRYLLHVRSLNATAVNSFIDVP